MEAAYGEQVGVGVSAVAADSMAATTGVQPGDVLISVRMPEETDCYRIPPTIDDLAQFAADTQPTDDLELLLLRKVGEKWLQIKCFLGKPIGIEVPEGVIAGAAPQAVEQGADGRGQAQPGEAAAAIGAHLPGCSFTSADPEQVLATAPGGAELLQRDVHIYGGLLAWAFGTMLTQGQEAIAQRALIDF